MPYTRISQETYFCRISNEVNEVHDTFRGDELEFIRNILGVNDILLGAGELLNRDNPQNIYYIDKVEYYWFLVHRCDGYENVYFECDAFEGLQECLTDLTAIV